MSLKEKIQPAAEIFAAGFILAVPGIAWVTVNQHRRLTHGSLEVDPALETVLDAEMKIYSPEPRIWAAVHSVHHSIPDAALDPFLDILEAIEWKRVHPDQALNVAIPEFYEHLDPFVKVFRLKDVMEIGGHARDIMRERLGGTYEPPSDYTDEELRDLLNPTAPRYVYQRVKHTGDYTQKEIARALLRDPHSPALMPKQNGVRGVLMGNVGLYRETSHVFRARPDLMPKHLRNENDSISRNRNFGDYTIGVTIPAVLTLIARGKYKPEDFAKAAAIGGAIFGVKLGFHIAGGNITNSLGHAGVMSAERFLRAIFSKEYKPKLNPDGTVSTDSVNGGLLGRLISTITFDEVGGQKEHHLGPDKIPYTSQKGIKAWIEAPWGMLLDVLARSKYFPLINTGPGFGLKEGEIRPDMPNPAMEIIHRRRVEQLRPSRE